MMIQDLIKLALDNDVDISIKVPKDKINGYVEISTESYSVSRITGLKPSLTLQLTPELLNQGDPQLLSGYITEQIQLMAKHLRA